jgi:acetylornithine deacetylase
MKTTEPVEQKSPNNFLELGENAVELLKNLISIPSFSKEEDKTADLIEKYFKKKGKTHREKNNVWALIRIFLLKNLPFCSILITIR